MTQLSEYELEYTICKLLNTYLYCKNIPNTYRKIELDIKKNIPSVIGCLFITQKEFISEWKAERAFNNFITDQTESEDLRRATSGSKIRVLVFFQDGNIIDCACWN